jgi:hypothetical protein
MPKQLKVIYRFNVVFIKRPMAFFIEPEKNPKIHMEQKKKERKQNKSKNKQKPNSQSNLEEKEKTNKQKSKARGIISQ